MRPQTQQHLKDAVSSSHLNIIRQTRKIIKGMTLQQRIDKAINHVNDALYFRHPRPEVHKPNASDLFKICYTWQVSNIWTWFLYICTYVYFYLIILDPKKYFVQKLTVQIVILTIYWIDVALYLFHKSYQTIKISSKFQTRFYIKLAVLILLVVDWLVFVISGANDIRYFRPFRFIRGLLPIFYDAITRKSVQAFISTYKDILIFIALYSCIILSFALTANQIVQFPEGWTYDKYASNYPDFVKSIYVIYTLSSYDAYPDNQYPAVRWSQWTYLFFLSFVLLNMFFFVTIPGTIIFNSYRQTRSKTMLIDQIRQQHSLILAFVSLGQQNYHIDNELLIRFLLALYKHKVRYVNYISDICLKLDQNNNGTIQISQFMQLGKILTKNSHMFPPQFNDFQPWMKFRKFINQKTHLKEIVKSWTYRLIANLFIVFTFFNCIAYFVTQSRELDTLDDVFQAVFVLDITLRVIGLGWQNFFKDKWNHVDFILVILVLLVEVIGSQNRPHNSDKLLKMARIFRIATLVKLFRGQTKKTALDHTSMYGRMRKLLGQTAIAIAIIIKFFPLFLLLIYFLGLIGMQLFHYAEQVPPTPGYSFYSEFSHFKAFMNSQYLMIQVLTQAGWSMVAFDYADRTKLYFPTILYFMMCHTFVVIIIAALIKALIWQAYANIHDQFQQNTRMQISLNIKQQKNSKKKQQFAQIRQIIEENGFIIPNTVIKRQFLENRLDIQIFKRLKQLYVKKISQMKSSKKRSGVIEQIVLDKKKYLMDEFSSQNQEHVQNEEVMNRLYQKIIRQNLKQDQLDAVEEEDFQEQMEELMEKLILHPKTKYSQTIVYPKVLLELLQEKMMKPFERKSDKRFDINRDVLENRDSIDFHTYQLNVLLEIQRSQRDQKMEIIKYMAEHHLITEQQAKNLFSKKGFQKSKHINADWIIRKMFLGETNEELIQKFQIEYFSDIYGQSFKQINKVTIQPLLKYQALLTYNFKNIMRYPQITNNNFFQIFTTIQDKISNNLLKKGSLFKFVYQIQTFSDNWFTVEFKQSQQIKIHFIKTGIWIYNKNMKENEVYYARDLFKWNLADRPDRMTCQKILKLLYQTFEGLAFGLVNQTNFFTSNPMDSIYDVYSFFVDVSKVERLIEQKLQVSKIMLVVLSKQQQRDQEDKLQYELTQILTQKQMKKDIDFKFDESEKQTFEKLKNFSVMDHQKIIESEGLPFAYVLNLMREMKDTLQIYSKTLVNQVQKILNQEFENN